MGKRSKQEKGEDVVGSDSKAIDPSSDDKQLKKSKKEKKKSKKEKKEKQSKAETGSDEPDKQSNKHSNKDKKDKKKKKKKKQEEEQGDSAEDQPSKKAKQTSSSPSKSKGTGSDPDASDKPASQQPGDNTPKTDKKSKKNKKNKKSKADKPQAAATEGGKKKGGSGVQFDFYQTDPAIEALTAKMVADMRTKDRVEVKGFGGESIADFKPIPHFNQSGMRKDVMKACASFEKPSPIQKHTWSIVLRGRDVVGIAATGSGKTLAFGLPGLMHVAARGQPGKGSPFMLVVAPTRELAMQTAKVLSSAGKNMSPPANVQCLYGGADRNEQIANMRKPVHVIVATPGRLLDLCEAGAVKLGNVSYCVLDEADRMLDLGFERDIKRIISQLASPRQTLMFSATWPQEVRNIARDYLNKPVKVCCCPPCVCV